jgi:hypothetical protein
MIMPRSRTNSTLDLKVAPMSGAGLSLLCT